MSFRPFTIVLLLATGYFHHNALAFPAPVNPYAPAQAPEAPPGSSVVVLADVTTTSTTSGTNLAATGNEPNGKPASLAVEPTGKSDSGKNGGELGKGGKGSKAAGLTQAELAEACAPLISGNPGKTSLTGGKTEKGDILGGKLEGGGKPEKLSGGKGDGGLGNKNTTSTGGKPPKKSSASVFLRSSVVTTAIPMILSTGVGLLIP